MTRSVLLAAAAGLVPALALHATSPTVEPRAVIGRIADQIEAVYFDLQAATRIAGELRADLGAGRFDALRDPRELAASLTDRLRREDAHFSIQWTPPTSTPTPGPPPVGSAPVPSGVSAAARENHGFRRVEVLPGNVGLVELTMLGHFEPDEPAAGSARGTADAAMAMLARAQALIVDLRDCRGGSPAMVGYLVGHFVDEGADVYNTFKSRGPDQYERPTVPIPEPRRLDLPLFIVTSGRTGSGAESLAYTLQAAKRATVVGERTAGGANPGDVVDLGDGLSIFISNGSPVNPITGRNWEGDGVQPDRLVGFADAEKAAYELALDAVIAREGRGPAADEARWTVESLRAARAAKQLRIEERAELAGNYGSRIIRREGDALIYVVDRRPPRRLIPLDAGLFTPEGVPYMRLEFERDASGRATVLVLRQVSGAVSRFARSDG
jgi:hypothetical protein